MSWLLANVYDLVMAPSEGSRIAAWRSELLAAARGDVLEIGAGTGANRELYPPHVRELVLTDPDRHMLRRLEKKLARGDLGGAKLVPAPVEALPFDDASFDTVVGTLVLCSVQDLDRAVSEIRRVLRPGGRYLFLEHLGAGEGTRRAQLQRALEPVWRRVAGNCHLTRQSVRALRSAGFDIEGEMREPPPRFSVPLLGEVARGRAIRRDD